MNATYAIAQITNILTQWVLKYLEWHDLKINEVALMNKDIIHSSHSIEDINWNMYINTPTKETEMIE